LQLPFPIVTGGESESKNPQAAFPVQLLGQTVTDVFCQMQACAFFCCGLLVQHVKFFSAQATLVSAPERWPTMQPLSIWYLPLSLYVLVAVVVVFELFIINHVDSFLISAAGSHQD